MFDPETDEPTLTVLWDELVGFENTGSGSIPKNGDGDDAEKARSIRTKGEGQRDRTVGKENSGFMGMEKGMVILVGFSELIYQGFSPEYLARFGRALLGWCRQVSLSSSLLAAARYHSEVLPRRTPTFRTYYIMPHPVPLLRYRPKRP